MKALGIYIHIPFCVAKCHYCDFCSFPNAGNGAMEKYTAQLCRRIEAIKDKTEERVADTVYFGGGTPSLLGAHQVERILRTLHDTLEISKNAEITLECNPATADKSKLCDLHSMGVNRLSIGLQSAVDSELGLLGRVHSAADFLQCYEDARAAGFDNISADLMYGIPEQTAQSFKYSIDTLCSLSPEHISSYGLMIEEGTEFYRRRHTLGAADEDTQAELYLMLGEELEKYGYQKYEISNFSRRGYRSKHNMRYWLGEEYIGLGVAAHSYFEGERYGNSRDIEAFIAGKDIKCESEFISAEEKRREYIMLRMRLADGMDISEYRARFGRELEDDIDVEKYVSGGFMKKQGDRVFFTDKGFLVSNSLLGDMID